MNLYKLPLSLSGLICFVVLAACSRNSFYAPIERDLSSAIVGGEVASSTEPITRSTVAVLITVTDQNQQGGQYVCAGTLIRSNVVLTAAHCAPKSDQQHYVRIYIAFTGDLENLDNGDVRLAIDQVVHPQFGEMGPRGEDQNDLALVKFAGALPAGYRALRVLPNENLLKPNGTMTLAGFGLTSGVSQKSDGLLRQVDVSLGESFGRTEMIIDQSQGRGACHGDSGGPAIVTIKGGPYLFGVISRGVGMDDCLSRGVITKVTAQSDFIDKALARLKVR